MFYCLVSHLFFCTQWQICFFSACLLLSVFYTRLLRPNRVETGRGLLILLCNIFASFVIDCCMGPYDVGDHF